jgi:ParB family chromosome partitioning protein
MSAIAAVEDPTFGGLVRQGESLTVALARLERRSNYARVIGSQEGQRLLSAIASAEQQARNGRSKHVEATSAAAPAPAEAATYVPTVGQLAWIPTGDIDIGPNVRVDPGELDEFAANIRALGILQPVKVRQVGDRWIVIWGQRRVLAARMIGLATVPALIESEEKVAAQVSIEQLSENLQKKDLNPIEEATAMRAVLDGTKGLTQVALARQLGRSEPWIASTLALLKAPAEVQELVRTDTLSIAHAKAIAGLPAPDQVRLAKSAVSNGVSAHSLEETAKWERSRQTDRDAGRKRNEAAASRGLAALEKAGTSKDAHLFVLAENWQIDDAEVRKLIQAAGYQVDTGWNRGGDRWAKCDCAALQLRIRDGEGSTIDPVCTSDAHYRAVEKERNSKASEKQAVEKAEREELHGAIRTALAAQPPHPTITRLLLRTFDSYGGDSWSEYAKKSDDEALAELAKRISVRHGTAYGKPVPARTVLKALAEPSAK